MTRVDRQVWQIGHEISGTRPWQHADGVKLRETDSFRRRDDEWDSGAW